MSELRSYQSPLTSRYASCEMSYLFSSQHKYMTWRKLWVALAVAEKKLGLPISDAQIKGLRAYVEHINFDVAASHEKSCHHDVMAHILTYGDQCPEARGIIHLGATSCFVTDNTDLIQTHEALSLLRQKIVQVIRHLDAFIRKTLAIPTLGYTHLQPAQPTTVGRRACLWLQDFAIDLVDLEHLIDSLHFLGVKGATGSQASYLSLFQGDHEKVKKLEELVAHEMGFKKIFPISGQTYTRKQDIKILSFLTSFAASSHKFATDLRLLAHLREVEEPFSKTQVGSSAMPHKKNPIHSERICGLARFLISLNDNPLYTEATQWLERTLDDSANRRLYFPQAFLTADALLNLLCPITEGLTVHPVIIQRHLDEELPFLATEAILMEAVKQGKDRQEIHEKLRFHCLEAARQIREEGKCPDLYPIFAKEVGLPLEKIKALSHADHFIGRSMEQAQEFLSTHIAPLLTQYASLPPPTLIPPL